MTDIKNRIDISTTRGANVYTFSINSGSPWGELFDASHEIHNKITELVNEGIKNSLHKEKAPASDETTSMRGATSGCAQDE